MCLFGGTPKPPALPTEEKVKVTRAPEETAKRVKIGKKRTIQRRKSDPSTQRSRSGTRSLRIPLDQGGGSNLNYG